MTKLILIFTVVLSGCSALSHKDEQVWQALNIVDEAQTYSAQHDRTTKYYEVGIARIFIGDSPSDESIVAYAIGSATIHATISQLLINHDKEDLAHLWNFITISTTAGTIGLNYSRGVRF